MFSGINDRVFQNLPSGDLLSQHGVICHEADPAKSLGRVLDFSKGDEHAGVILAQISTGYLPRFSVTKGSVGSHDCRFLQAEFDDDAGLATIGIQCAGLFLQKKDIWWYGLGSGPARLVAADEKLFLQETFRGMIEHPSRTILVVEANEPPKGDVFKLLYDKTGLDLQNITIAFAPVKSEAGAVQVAARAVECACYRLEQLGFDLRRVKKAIGKAPIAPVEGLKTAQAMVRVNEAIAAMGEVELWIEGDVDEDLVEKLVFGYQLPPGATFGSLYREVEGDFGKLAEKYPEVFAPARVILHFGSEEYFSGMTKPEQLSWW